MSKPIANAFDGVYRKTILDNGVRIVTEDMPGMRSLALGMWFDTGSRDEPEEFSGISHFLEHMNFKGTERRSAAAIARQIEGRGGHLNAFTSKETTCFFARIIDDQLPVAVDVLADIAQHSKYADDEVNRERGVILEELKNVEDTPDEWVFDHFIEQLFNGHSMARPVLGIRQSLLNITRATLVSYRSQRYTTSRAVVAAAGRIDHQRLARLVERRLNSSANEVAVRLAPPPVKAQNRRREVKTNTQQTHICWGCRAYDYKDKRKWILLVLNTLLGGGMSSRLFQSIREKYGLAYSVYSFMETYFDTGVFGVYAGTEPKQAERALQLIQSEARDLVRQPISQRELNFNKDQLKGSLLIGLESPTSRMHRLAKMELYTGRWISLDEVKALIDAVTIEDIRRTAKELFEERPLFTVMLLPN